MEKSDSCKCHHHSILIAGIDNCVITDRSARLCNIFHATLMCTLNIITEREECIGTKLHP